MNPNSRPNRSISMESLPDDALANIFQGLPFESVAMCKCVSKPWNTLIYDRLRPSSSSSPNSTLLVARRSGLLNFRGDKSPPEAFNSKTCIKVIGTCHGLMCLLREGENVVRIWNPVTQESRDFSFTAVAENYFMAVYSYFGFGFDSVNQDYKIVRVIQSRFETKVEICPIYAGTTRLVVLPVDQAPFQLTDAAPVTAANGSCFWIAVNLRNRNLEIVRFNMVTEEFVQIPFAPGMPDIALEYTAIGDIAMEEHRIELDIDGTRLRLGNYSDNVCLIVTKTSEVEIWCIMNISDSTWSKQFCIQRRDKIDVVLGFSGYENEELVITVCETVYACDRKKGRLVLPMWTGKKTQAVAFVQSIVPLQPPAQHLMSRH